MRPTPEQQDFRAAIQDFARRECGTREQREKLIDPGEHAHSSALYRQMADLGWLGVAIPEEHGGSGGTYVDQTIFFEEIYRGIVPIEAIGPSTTVAGCYKRFGSEAQKADALSQIADGTVMAISISEPEAGSDVAAISCSARPGDGGYVINGQKTWCSYAHIAGRILLVARTSKEEARHHGLSILEVPGDAEGITTHKIPTMGGDEVNDVFFTDTFVPEAAIVGEVGRGFQQIMAGLDGERLLAAAVGPGDRPARARRPSRLRHRAQAVRPTDRHLPGAASTGSPISRSSSSALGLITYDVAERLEAGASPETTRLTSMAKVKATETAKKITLEGMQMMGGYGYASEYDMESLVRHALVLPIYAGTNEVQREIISGSLGLR